MSRGLRCTPYCCSITNAVVMGLEWHSGKLVLLWSLCSEPLCCFLCSITAFLCWAFRVYENIGLGYFCSSHYPFPRNTTELFMRSTPTAMRLDMSVPANFVKYSCTCKSSRRGHGKGVSKSLEWKPVNLNSS